MKNKKENILRLSSNYFRIESLGADGRWYLDKRKYKTKKGAMKALKNYKFK